MTRSSLRRKKALTRTKMTVSELFRTGTEILKSVGIDDAEFDARCMAEFALNCDSFYLRMNGSDTVGEADAKTYFDLIDRRMNGEPLQYLLGEWEFMGLSFKVGKGVLIPRPETELLVEFAIDFLKDKSNPVVFDLCSGSGCIAISVAKLCPNSMVYAVEKSDIAFGYLEENIKLNGVNNIKAVKGDIFDKNLLSELSPDLILSNPPYIRSDEIDGLQKEVKREPAMALDGGEDGYDFYHALSDDWIRRLKKGGAIAVECAEDQTEYICDLFSDFASETKAYKDYSGLPRGVIAAI